MIGELFAVCKLYLLLSTLWRTKPKSVAIVVGIISVTDPESGRTEAFPSCVITAETHRVGSEMGSESAEIAPWPLVES